MNKRRTRRKATPKQPKSRVPLIVAATGLLLLAVALLVYLRSGTAATYTPEVVGSPALQVDEEKIDLGDVPLGEWVSASFTLTNIGDRPLQFSRSPYVEVVGGC